MDRNNIRYAIKLIDDDNRELEVSCYNEEMVGQLASILPKFFADFKGEIKINEEDFQIHFGLK